MSEPQGDLAAITPDTALQDKPGRWRWGLATLVCACALLWCGFSLHQRLTCPWQVVHVIPGFVRYGSHDTEFSPDGSMIAIGHRDKSKVLDWIAGRELSTLEHYEGQGIAAFSSDGKIVSRLSDGKKEDREAYLWNASDGRILGRVQVPEEVAQPSSPFFSPDNKKIVAECAEGLITWDLADLTRVGRIKITRSTDTGFRSVLSWHPVTHEMTAVDADGKLLTIDLQKETATPLLAKQERAVQDVEWSPDGMRLVTIDRADGAVAVWDVPSGQVVANVSEKEAVYARFSPDGKRILTTKQRSDVVRSERWAPPHWDRYTRIWNARTGELIQDLPTTSIVSLSPDWSFWREAGPEGVRIARFDGSELCAFPGRFDGHGSTCVFSQDSRHFVYVNASGLVVVWQYRGPVRSWTDWLTLRELWMTVLVVAGLVWSVRGWTATKVA